MESTPGITFYIDEDYRCHTENGAGRREMQSDFFVGREESITRYRYIPAGERWTRADGVVFHGEMMAMISD